MHYFKKWYARTFSNPEVGILALLLLVGLGVVLFAGRWLVPVFAAVVIAYLLEGQVRVLERRGIGRIWAVILVFLLFMAFAAFVILLLVPLLIKQITQLLNVLPGLLAEMQSALIRLPDKYPQFISERWVKDVVGVSQSQAMGLINRALSFSAASIVGLVYMMLYLIIVPLMVFFFLKDKEGILAWFSARLPRERGLAVRVWHDVDRQMGNYVRGKFFEILIVWAVSFTVFAILGLPFAALVGLLVGISVLVPYVGATVVTLPVAIVAYLEWGIDTQLLWVLVAYAIIQALDGNLLAPLLFAEVVDLHPVAIIVAVLFFGGLWGFWGVSFAIPLATVVKSVMDAWPRAWRAAVDDDGKLVTESPTDPGVSQAEQGVSVEAADPVADPEAAKK